ncbi:conjugal transfer protein TraG N-terminal domain-containing protein [Glaesserella parasuis]|uniref:conjugal transfer protein TraG N-terminal domain-containing protein n=1 Tax=Glaesserella parasuis TaxID=738 RepID=UPI003CF7652E
MNISLTVDSYFEYFLTLLGWIINNGIWDLLVQSGLFAAPILFHVIGLFLKVREQGDDEGEKGLLLASWIETKIYIAITIMVLTCLPLFNVSYTTLQFNTERMKSCGHSIYKPSDTGLSSLSSELNGKSATLPLWWAFTYSVGKGLTHGAVSIIPCKADLRQIRFDIQHTQIKSPVLRQEITDFVEQCFIPSRSKIKRQKLELDEVQSRDVDWIGSNLLLNSPGFYDVYRAKSPIPYWTYDTVRDIGLPNTGNGGFPSCKEWWSNSDVGLKKRILEQVDVDVLTRVKKIWSNNKEYENIIVRSIVRPQNLSISSGQVYNGYGGSTDPGFFDATMRTVGTLSNLATGVFTFPAFDSVRQSLPMIHGLLLLAITIAIPILTVFSGYNIRATITISLVQFGLFFLTFWWELARWIDSWIISALYDSDTHSRWNWAGIQNAQDDLILQLVTGVMFIIIPALWFGMMSWAGINAGISVGNFISNGTNVAKNTLPIKYR